jgi:hypothetical protein
MKNSNKRKPEWRIYNLYPPLARNSITRTMEKQLFCDKKDDARRIVNSVRRYMGLIMLYYKNKEIEEKGEPQGWLASAD